jgi:protein phosphatase
LAYQNIPFILPQKAMLLLIGAPGSGKSTFAQQRFPDSWVLSSDEARARICDDPSNQSVSTEAFEMLNYMARARLSHNRPVVIDATNVAVRDRRHWLSLAARYRYSSYMLIFDIPLDICLNRNEERERVVPEHIVEDLWEQTRRFASKAMPPKQRVLRGDRDIASLEIEWQVREHREHRR